MQEKIQNDNESAVCIIMYDVWYSCGKLPFEYRIFGWEFQTHTHKHSLCYTDDRICPENWREFAENYNDFEITFDNWFLINFFENFTNPNLCGDNELFYENNGKK